MVGGTGGGGEGGKRKRGGDGAEGEKTPRRERERARGGRNQRRYAILLSCSVILELTNSRLQSRLTHRIHPIHPFPPNTRRPLQTRTTNHLLINRHTIQVQTRAYEPVPKSHSGLRRRRRKSIK